MSEVPQRRPRRAVWVFPESLRQYNERRAASPSPLPGYLCERCQDAPAVQWQSVPGGGEMGVGAACSRRESGAAAADASPGRTCTPARAR